MNLQSWPIELQSLPKVHCRPIYKLLCDVNALSIADKMKLQKDNNLWKYGILFILSQVTMSVTPVLIKKVSDNAYPPFEKAINKEPLKGLTSIFKSRGRISPRSLNAHMILTIDLRPFSKKQEQLLQVDSRLGQYAIETKSNKSASAHRALREAKTLVKDRISHTGVLTNDTLDILNLENLRSHPGAVFRSFSYEILEVGGKVKRQAVLLAAVIAGSVGSLITSMLTSGDATAIMSHQKDLLIKQIDKDKIIINQHSADLATLNETLFRMDRDYQNIFLQRSRDHLVDFLYHITTSVVRTTRGIEKQLLALNSARRGIFSLDLLNLKDLDDALKDLNKKALEQNLRLSITHPLELEGMSCAVVVSNSQELHLILEIPVLENSVFELYELSVFSTPTGFNDSGVAFYMRFSNEHRLLMINNDNTLYSTLSDSQLAGCKQINGAFYCSEIVLYKSSKKSCLLSLYLNNRKSLVETCPSLISTDNEDVVQLDDTKYLIINPCHLTVKCHHKNSSTTTNRVELTKPTVINVETGCVINAPNFIIDRSAISLSKTIKGTLIHHETTLSDFVDQVAVTSEGLLCKTKEEKETFEKFVYEHTIASRQKINLDSVAENLKFHAKMEEARLADKLANPWKVPSIPDMVRSAITSVISLLVFCVFTFVFVKLIQLCLSWKTSPRRNRNVEPNAAIGTQMQPLQISPQHPQQLPLIMSAPSPSASVLTAGRLSAEASTPATF